MASDRILAVTKHIIREGAKLGIDEVGTRIFGSAGMPVKNVVLTPVFGELQKRYPKLFLADDPEALAAAKEAEAALVSDPMLTKMLEEGFAKVAGSNDEILRASPASMKPSRRSAARLTPVFSDPKRISRRQRRQSSMKSRR